MLEVIKNAVLSENALTHLMHVQAYTPGGPVQSAFYLLIVMVEGRVVLPTPESTIKVLLTSRKGRCRGSEYATPNYDCRSPEYATCNMPLWHEEYFEKRQTQELQKQSRNCPFVRKCTLTKKMAIRKVFPSVPGR